MEASASPERRLPEAAALTWRTRVEDSWLRRQGRLWTAWTVWVVVALSVPAIVLVYLEPLTFPVALVCLAHVWGIPWLQARRGANSVVPIGSERSASPAWVAGRDPERVALGLLGDLVGHEKRELVMRTGLALERGRLGAWVVGEQGALMVRPGGRRVDCWCVRVADPGELPGGDRVAHLLLALREDERDFATVANLAFSGALWRVRRHLPESARAALDAARAEARPGSA